ncbi:MAG: hypothetical protein AAGA68_23290 [Pseudomonadota bacterium]
MAMLTDTRQGLDDLGYACSSQWGRPGDDVIERAFVERRAPDAPSCACARNMRRARGDNAPRALTVIVAPLVAGAGC